MKTNIYQEKKFNELLDCYGILATFDLTEEILTRIIENKLTKEDYIALYHNFHLAPGIVFTAIQYAPKEVLFEMLLKTKEGNFTKTIIERLGNLSEKQADKILKNIVDKNLHPASKTACFAIKYCSYDYLISYINRVGNKLNIEANEEVIKRLKSYAIDEEIADEIIEMSDDSLKSFLIDYVSFETMIQYYDISILHYQLGEKIKEKILTMTSMTVEQASLLLSGKFEKEIKCHALKFASKSNVIYVLTNEHDTDIMQACLERLKIVL